MADYDWTKPTPGGSSGTWGTELNTILDVIQAHPGIKVVADADAKAAYVPLLGQVILQADTGVLYKCTNATGPVWAEVGPAAVADSTLTTKGDLLVYGSALARLGVGTDGQVLTADSGQALGVKWAAASGGGGGVPERWYVPGSADEGYDDEFDDGSIDNAWETVDKTNYENSWYEPSGIKGLSLLTKPGKGSYQVTGILKSIGDLEAPFYIETAIKMNTKLFDYPGAGLIFSDGVAYGSGVQVSSCILMSNFYISLTLHTGFNSRASYNDFDRRHYGASQDRLYLRMSYPEANKFSVYWSIDGVVWYLAHDAVSLTLTPTHMGLCATGHDNDSNAIMANFAYFRARSGAPANG